MNKSNTFTILRVLTVLLVAAAVLTLIPHAGAGKANYIGYRSLCTFTPVSTAILGFIAYSIDGYRKKLMEKGGIGS
jgi:hypothetical protein